jgi:hypothetical protein|tara:strand:+ start:1252 stop:1527 length:276 start_codon:yes stop_codon:yes gene_type:complete
MKTFIVFCKDKENSLKKRLDNRDEHLQYLKNNKDKLLMAGPILNNDDTPKGSVLILRFKTKDDLKNFLKEDPYVQVDLFEEVTIEVFKKVF